MTAWFLSLTNHLRDGWPNWAMLLASLWLIGLALDLFGKPCLEGLGFWGRNFKRLFRGLMVYVAGILIGVPVSVWFFGGSNFVRDLGLLFSFLVAAKIPGLVEGVLIGQALFGRRK